ncbi:unnamed protein product [Adineta steineri]|uniref:Cytochrome b561 domain-containing protein n=3 Tax=Adineta steineri TaxID=433720 RepID=A0A820BGV9_9BILA|nr:unnamed protein product [Adineta steineri]CAF0838982.1 unnamed protein product [Adineta steineri]CAF3868645.1 unnamed protein product [Adineta steineri]CAF4206153.1 unnamed protein product [Adineta steineri]
MFVIFGKDRDLAYPTLLTVCEILGLFSIFLSGLLFDKKLYASKYVYSWDTNPFSFHPLMMTLGLLFCYGNAILLYRTFKSTPKPIVKILHASLLILSLIFAGIGLAAVIRGKYLGKRPHFQSFHSWLGLTTVALFVLQWICGFVSFLVPQLSLNIRQAYMPSHRLWGKIIFLSATVAILTGLSEHGYGSSFFTAGDAERKRRLILNFFGVFTSLFSLFVIYLLSNPEYRRLPDEDVVTNESNT